jgi:radical SAM superfamily enzyme YgiQ (UPF0313 family)
VDVKQPGAILLVACYELGHQPLAVAWPAAFLEREGYAPAVMDVSVEPFDAERVRRAKLVAISVPMHTALRLGVTVARRVRAVNPDCHIAFYGLYATLNSSHLLGGIADSVMSGEIEAALVELVRRLEAGSHAPTHASPSRVLAKLEFPAPSRASLPSLKKYAHLERDGRFELVGHVEASRGCKHMCRHCPIPPVYGGRFFVVPIDVLLADIRQQVQAGATHITFGDPDFLNGPGHAMAVARALHESLASSRSTSPRRSSTCCVTAIVCPSWRGSAVRLRRSAAESLNDTILEHLDKGHTRADIEAAVRLTRDAGIALRPTWVAFTPWTTLEDYRELLDFVEAHGLVDSIDPCSIRSGCWFTRLAPARARGASPVPGRAGRGSVLSPLDPSGSAHGSAARRGRRSRRSAADSARRRRRHLPARGRARRSRGGRGAAADHDPRRDRKRAPRLTEPWFC